MILAALSLTFFDSNHGYMNPVINRNRPDPGVLALPDGSGYVAVTTGVESGNAFPIMTSTDLVDWKEVSQVLEYPD